MKKIKKFIDDYRHNGESEIAFSIPIVQIIIFVIMIALAVIIFS